MKEFVVNIEKKDNRYYMHELECSNCPHSNFFYIEAISKELAIIKLEEKTGKKYYFCEKC